MKNMNLINNYGDKIFRVVILKYSFHYFYQKYYSNPKMTRDRICLFVYLDADIVICLLIKKVVFDKIGKIQIDENNDFITLRRTIFFITIYKSRYRTKIVKISELRVAII